MARAKASGIPYGLFPLVETLLEERRRLSRPAPLLVIPKGMASPRTDVVVAGVVREGGEVDWLVPRHSWAEVKSWIVRNPGSMRLLVGSRFMEVRRDLFSGVLAWTCPSAADAKPPVKSKGVRLLVDRASRVLVAFSSPHRPHLVKPPPLASFKGVTFKPPEGAHREVSTQVMRVFHKLTGYNPLALSGRGVRPEPGLTGTGRGAEGPNG